MIELFSNFGNWVWHAAMCFVPVSNFFSCYKFNLPVFSFSLFIFLVLSALSLFGERWAGGESQPSRRFR